MSFHATTPGKVLSPSKEALDASVIREMLTGEEYRRKLGERQREQQAAREALEMRNGRTLRGLGKAVAVIPQADFFYLHQKYGEEMHTKEWLRWFQREYSHLSPNKI